MLIEIKVPELSEGTTEATVVSWHKAEGDLVKKGENLVDVETAKVVVEVPAPESGVLTKILKVAGSTVAPGELLAQVEGEGEVAATAKPESAGANTTDQESSMSAASNSLDSQPELVAVMPSAKKILAERGIAAADVNGTGRGGRVSKQDALSATQVSGNSRRFDVVVIGGGPGGYVAAIRAAQLGFSVACIEKESFDDPQGKVRLGGTCLNVGCIPSKALLQSSQMFDEANHAFGSHGISADNLKMDVTAMMARKENIVIQLTQGVRGLFKKNKITLLEGHGRFIGRNEQLWQLEAGSESVEAKHVIVATGSRPRHLPGVPVDNVTVCDNSGALSLKSVPKRLGVIGAGVIGLELGSVWKRLGAEVKILEAGPEFLGAADQAIAKEAWKVITKQGLDIQLGVTIKSVTSSVVGVRVEYVKDGKEEQAEFDKLIVSVGRIPNTDGLNAESVGLALDPQGRVNVDEHCHSNLENVWAVGDVVRGPMLAHKGMEEGVMVAEMIAGQVGHIDMDAVPWVIYTHPEIAWVGKTEQQLKAAGVEYRVGQIPFLANGRALSQGDPSGFVKILADAKTDRVLGMHVFGNNASELISEGVTAIEFGATSEDIARICHAHPSLSEAVHEAALAVDKRALHF